MLEKAFIRHFKQRFAFPTGSKILVNLSGGVDSTALLHLLKRTQLQLPSPSSFDIRAVHFNHRTRDPLDHAQETSFVQSLCEDLSVPLYIEEWDDEDDEDRSANFQERAREWRYDRSGHILHTWMLDQHQDSAVTNNACGFVATGHHREDDLETFWMKLLRGCSLTSLQTLPFATPLNEEEEKKEEEEGERQHILFKLKPLLPFSKLDLIDFLKTESACSFPIVEDVTNLDPTHNRRNLFRHTVLPALHDYMNFKTPSLSHDTLYHRIQAISEQSEALERWIEFASEEKPLSSPSSVLEVPSPYHLVAACSFHPDLNITHEQPVAMHQLASFLTSQALPSPSHNLLLKVINLIEHNTSKRQVKTILLPSHREGDVVTVYELRIRHKDVFLLKKSETKTT